MIISDYVPVLLSLGQFLSNIYNFLSLCTHIKDLSKVAENIITDNKKI